MIEKKHYWQGLKECFCDLQSQSIGSNERMTMQDLQILKQPKVELFPNGSSHPASQIKTELPPASRPDFVLATPIAAKNTKTTN